MRLADILVHVDQTDEGAARLRLAGDLARRHGSTLIALFVREFTPAQLHKRAVAELGRASPRQIEGVDRHVHALIDGVEKRLQALLGAIEEESSAQVEWRSTDGPATAVVPQHARCADICIVGHDGSTNQDSIEYRFSEKLLFVTGRPVLYVPRSTESETLGRRIAVAWNSSRAATRALNDAIPLFERADETTILTANPDDFIERHGAMPVGQMVAHLRRHGLSIEAKLLEDVPSNAIADVLQAEALSLGADLLVAGAFGPPKFWEDLIGGVTRDLLSGMRLPILMSH